MTAPQLSEEAASLMQLIRGLPWKMKGKGNLYGKEPMSGGLESLTGQTRLITSQPEQPQSTGRHRIRGDFTHSSPETFRKESLLWVLSPSEPPQEGS